MEIAYASMSEKGKRPYQEDSVGIQVCDTEALFLLADGLGGHGCGDVASGEIVNYAKEEFREGNVPDAYFQKIFCQGNERLIRLQDEKQMQNGMKTTLASVLIKEKTIYGSYIGDSRIYVFENEKLLYRSLDHSVPQMLVAAGELKESQIRNHPDRNRLLRVLGDRDRVVKPQSIGSFPIQGRGAVLLCSDGFWENILENEMEKSLKKAKSPQHWLDKMGKIVGRRGFWKNQDNYSAVCVWVS